MSRPGAISIQDRMAQARALAGAGRLVEALELLKGAPATEAPATWTMQGQLLQALGRLDDLLAVRLAQAKARPDSMANQHNVAAVLGDLGRSAEAEAAARRAFAMGGDAPETWLVLARALMGQDRYDEADQAFREVLKRRPGDLGAITDLAQLIWMRTEDLSAALQPVEAALVAFPEAAPLHVVRSRLKRFAGAEPREIWRDLTSAPPAVGGALEMAAAHAALGFDRDLALKHARAAMRWAPGDPAVALQLAEVHLARDEAAEALPLLEAMLAHDPLDQQAIAFRNTAWRMLGDPRAPGPAEYAAVVAGYVIDTPPGWASLEAYLADLAPALRRLHNLTTHPVGQSLRHGTQTSADLTASRDPVIQAFFTAIDGPIRTHLKTLGQGADPLRSRNTGAYRVAGCWSVQLRPGGFHTPHFHSKGWLSSACHIELPAAVDAGGKEGWLGFGAPAFDGVRPLEPDHYEKPEPGRLVLFPSYMWHGTVPFSGDQSRLTIAFDLVPA
jgi:tetratricopeptide (TPR) repeat protein